MAVEQLEDVKRFAKAMEIDTATVTRMLVFQTFDVLTLKTPVDTGRARANWQISIGQPASGVVTSFEDQSRTKKGKKRKGRRPNTTRPPKNPEATPNINYSTIDGKSPVWITNNLDYIEYLEEGSSKQAPNGMIALAFAEIQGEIDARIAAELG